MSRFYTYIFLCLFAVPLWAQDVRIQVDVQRRYQQIEGFGGFAQIVPWWLDWQRYSEENKKRLFDQLVYDLRLNMIRIPFPAGAESENDNADPNTLDMSRFDVRRIFPRPGEAGKYDGEVNVDPYSLQELHARGIRTFLMSAWSVAPWVKESNNIYGGHIASRYYDEFAEQWAGVILAFRQQLGIEITHVGLFNEPEIFVGYSHTEANAREFRDLLPRVKARFEREGLQTKIVGPEPADAKSEFFYQDWVPDNILPDLDTFAFHHYPAFMNLYEGYSDLERVATAGRERGRRLWQTEISNLPSAGGDISKADTYAEGLALAYQLHNALVFGNVNAWYWWKLWDFNSTTDSGGRPAAQRLVYINQTSGEPTFSPKYWAYRQFTRYIPAGAYRIDSNTGDNAVLASAYADDQDLTIILINRGTGARQAEVAISGRQLDSMTLSSYAEGNIGGLEKVVANNDKLLFRLPAQSVLTLTTREESIQQPPPVDRTPPGKPRGLSVRVQ